MDEIVVNATPQMAPISDMRNRQNELLTGKKDRALAQIAALAQPYGPPDLARNFDKYMNRVSDDEPTEHIVSTHDDNEDEVDAFAEIAALAQPLGPADLSTNFDKYTKQFSA
ncbi:MAG: hypothetical protein DYG89_50420 [Caldilinea sp. CFX5]|nr:hypothetical protein [Caldilinea sp. CFX5]